MSKSKNENIENRYSGVLTYSEREFLGNLGNNIARIEYNISKMEKRLERIENKLVSIDAFVRNPNPPF